MGLAASLFFPLPETGGIFFANLSSETNFGYQSCSGFYFIKMTQLCEGFGLFFLICRYFILIFYLFLCYIS